MLNKEATIEEKKIGSLIVYCEIFSDEINNMEVSNRLLFLSLSKNKNNIIYSLLTLFIILTAFSGLNQM